jgi:hypothetical protein
LIDFGASSVCGTAFAVSSLDEFGECFQFGAIDRFVFVGVDAIHPLSQSGRDFFSSQFAVAVAIRILQNPIDHFVGIAVCKEATFAGPSFRKLRSQFFQRDFSVLVLIQLGK